MPNPETGTVELPDGHDARGNREGGSGMTKRQYVGALVVLAVLPTGALSGCARRTEVAEAPVPEAAPPEAGEAPVDTAAPEFRVPDGCVVSPENDRAEGEAGYRIVHEETGIELVYVPGGSFLMGTSDREIEHMLQGLGAERRSVLAEELRTEQPQHERLIEAFWIGRTEVTVRQWRSVVRSAPEGNDQGEDHPVTCVSWDDCEAFCQSVALELPTEAQWEYAARGPEGNVYPWGNEWDEKRCCNAKNRGAGRRTLQVGSLPAGASWCGALDMAGNVWEWCMDLYYEDAYDRYAGGDPPSPDMGEREDGVLRGGAWGLGAAQFFRSSSRQIFLPRSDSDNWNGFRCARGL